MEEWGEWCAVVVTAIVSTTAPNNKKQKKVGMKYLVKILWESSLKLLVQCSLAFSLLRYLSLSREVTGEQRKGGEEG